MDSRLDSPLKQRLIGAAVLVALAVIFLPMLVQGPAPDSGVSNVPLSMPDTPHGDYQTRDLPLVAPGNTPQGGAVGMQPAHADGVAEAGVPAAGTPAAIQPIADNSPATVTPVPASGSTAESQPATSASLPDQTPITKAPLPAMVAGGDYAVSIGAFATQAAADNVIAALRTSQLHGYREATSTNGKPAWRVRVGPYATRADAEAARLRIARVRNDSAARVIALDAQDATTTSTASFASITPKPIAKPTESVPSTATGNASSAISTAKSSEPTPAKQLPDAAATKATATSAAADTGFAIQLAAFSKPEDATALRDKLRAAGFTAFTESVATDKGTLTRVRVGPVVSRVEADQLKAQVKAKLGLDGIVRPHP